MNLEEDVDRAPGSRGSAPPIESPARAMSAEPGSSLRVTNNEAKRRFEVSRGGKVAFLRYRIDPPLVSLLHVEVPLEVRGLGMGGILARAVLEFARERQLKVVPLCPFVAGYISNGHLEYLALVSPEHRALVMS